MALKKDPDDNVQRRYYPQDRESSGNILNDAAHRTVRALFQKSIKGAINDGSLQAFLEEIGYGLVKRPKRKAKQKPPRKPVVQSNASVAKGSTRKTSKPAKRRAAERV